jgi:hypothetical protein
MIEIENQGGGRFTFLFVSVLYNEYVSQYVKIFSFYLIYSTILETNDRHRRVSTNIRCGQIHLVSRQINSATKTSYDVKWFNNTN